MTTQILVPGPTYQIPQSLHPVQPSPAKKIHVLTSDNHILTSYNHILTSDNHILASVNHIN